MKFKKIAATVALLAAVTATANFRETVDRVSMKTFSVYRSWAEADSTFKCGVIIQTPADPTPRRLPAHVVVAIDVSREMQGEPLTYAKKAASHILNRLQDGDYFSVISFSTYTRTVFPLQRINSGIRRTAESGIDGIASESNRNLVEGMDAAVAQFERFKGQSASGRHLFIFTNGDADKGTVENPQVLSHAYSLSQKASIDISTFGIEYSYNEKLLSEIANKTGGSYYYAEEPELLEALVEQEIRRVIMPAARSVRLRVDLPKSTTISEVFGGEKSGAYIKVGGVPAAARQLVFFELKGRPVRQQECIVEMEYTEPESQDARIERGYVDIALTDGNADYEPEIAPYYLVFSLMEQLVTYSGHVYKNRRGYTDFFRSRLIDLEQENVAFDSDFLQKSFVYLEQLDRRISNTAVEPEELVKGIKFDMLQFLRGNLIK
ncbi:MAG: vWA domain-containing protein [Fibrobacterota bacterium]